MPLTAKNNLKEIRRQVYLPGIMLGQIILILVIVTISISQMFVHYLVLCHNMEQVFCLLNRTVLYRVGRSIVD
jgi:hypothetical protein